MSEELVHEYVSANSRKQIEQDMENKVRMQFFPSLYLQSFSEVIFSVLGQYIMTEHNTFVIDETGPLFLQRSV